MSIYASHLIKVHLHATEANPPSRVPTNDEIKQGVISGLSGFVPVGGEVTVSLVEQTHKADIAGDRDQTDGSAERAEAEAIASDDAAAKGFRPTSRTT